MKRKHIYILLTLIIACTSYAIGQKTRTKKITVMVIDKANNKPVENAELTLNTLTGNDLTSEIKNTDQEGLCRFSFDLNPSYRYELYVKKHQYFTYYDPENNKLSDFYKVITLSTEKEITFYLTSDSLNRVAYYESINPRYPIDTLIQMLKRDIYLSMYIPPMTWDDIPRLLEIGNDPTIITHFPRNPFSSSGLNYCHVGTISLWLIESIRISDPKNIIAPSGKGYPSLTPILNEKNKEALTRDPNSIDKMEKAYQAYKDWWQTVMSMNSKDASKINPLENTGLYW